MSRRIHIAIGEPSIIIRSGVVAVLKRLSELNIDLVEIADISQLTAQLCRHKPDILIISPSNLGLLTPLQIRSDIDNEDLKCIALQSNVTDSSILNKYDSVISIHDSSDNIANNLREVIKSDNKTEQKKELSGREQEIVVCIVKGMTNKQIAEQLHLSTHTVITHRRNISNKLQIHSPSGLTIYAIVNKLIELNDIKFMLSND